MSDSSTFPSRATVTSNFAQQTSNPPVPFQGSTPPLLPAFLITGVLLAAIVIIIVWRHLVERRHVQREDDPTWPTEAMISGSNGPKGPKPKLWDLEIISESEGATWRDIMPLSATALRAAPKPRRPRYLVPSDRPMTLFSRMFGGERRPPRPTQPPISLLAPTQSLPRIAPPDNDDDEEPIDRLQVAVLVSLPHPRRVRRASYLSEKARDSTDIRPPPSEPGNLTSVREGSDAEDASLSCKGKKRSLETPLSHGYDPKAYYNYDDEESQLELALGTVVMPFVEEGY